MKGKSQTDWSGCFRSIVDIFQIIGGLAGLVSVLIAVIVFIYAIRHPDRVEVAVHVLSGVTPSLAPSPESVTVRMTITRTPTATPTATPSLASTSVGTPTPTDISTATSTATSMSSPTATLTSTPVPTPIPFSALTVLFQDDFGNSHSGWDTDRGAEYKKGELVIYHTCCWSFNDSRPFLIFDNFILEVDSRWSGGAVGWSYGVRFRYEDFDNYYVFYVGNDGRYTVGKKTGGEWNVLIEGFSDAIERTGGVNRFHIEAKDHNLRCFMNGQFLCSVRDEDHDQGDIVLITIRPEEASSRDFSEVSFDNVAVAKHP